MSWRTLTRERRQRQRDNRLLPEAGALGLHLDGHEGLHEGVQGGFELGGLKILEGGGEQLKALHGDGGAVHGQHRVLHLVTPLRNRGGLRLWLGGSGGALE